MFARSQLAPSLVLCLALAAPGLAVGRPAGDPPQERDQAALAFQRDLVSVLAPRADALPLLGAALLARPLEHQPKANDFHHLISRAAAAPGHGPAQDWTRLSDCDTDCPNPDALARLLEQAPDNAAVWLLKLGRDTRDGHQAASRADLAKAAAASGYDDYAGASMEALARTVGTLPPPAAALDAEGAGAAGLQAVLVFGIAHAQPQPAMQAAAQLCEEGADDPALKRDCLALGRVLEWGSSPLARSLGLHLREVLADDPAQQQAAQRARRDLVWQVQQFSRLGARATGDAHLARRLLALARSGGTEMSLMLAALRDAGIPTDAPPAWKPHAPD